MSNHYHVVVRINQAQARSWSEDEVIRRWLKLYRGPVLVHRFLSGEASSTAEREVITELAATWRERLTDLGWFMRNINEPIAREANKEDGCKGRFWEGRYKCQALLDERALLTCMAYVDLNPVRAGMSDKPETSAHTAIKARIEGQDHHLASFLSVNTLGDQTHSRPIPFALRDYLELVDWTGRAISTTKRGYLPESLPLILERLQLSGKPWLAEIRHYGKWYGRAVGAAAKAQAYCEATGTRWLRGVTRHQSSPSIVPG